VGGQKWRRGAARATQEAGWGLGGGVHNLWSGWDRLKKSSRTSSVCFVWL